MRDRFLPTPAGWDARRYSHVYKGVAEPVGVVSPVPQQGGGGWGRGQQSPRDDVIRGLPRDFGKYRRSRSDCASDNQNRSLVITPHFGGLIHVASRRSNRFMGLDTTARIGASYPKLYLNYRYSFFDHNRASVYAENKPDPFALPSALIPDRRAPAGLGPATAPQACQKTAACPVQGRGIKPQRDPAAHPHQRDLAEVDQTQLRIKRPHRNPEIKNRPKTVNMRHFIRKSGRQGFAARTEICDQRRPNACSCAKIGSK